MIAPHVFLAAQVAFASRLYAGQICGEDPALALHLWHFLQEGLSSVADQV
jgi:hypothetical protein